MLNKPPHGTPCNNCGLCCEVEICPLGVLAFRLRTAPCPALVIDGDRQVCGLVLRPENYAPIRASLHGTEAMRAAALTAIGSGVGCDARLDEERGVVPPPEYVAAMAAIKRQPAAIWRGIDRLWRDAR